MGIIDFLRRKQETKVETIQNNDEETKREKFNKFKEYIEIIKEHYEFYSGDFNELVKKYNLPTTFSEFSKYNDMQISWLYEDLHEETQKLSQNSQSKTTSNKNAHDYQKNNKKYEDYATILFEEPSTLPPLLYEHYQVAKQIEEETDEKLAIEITEELKNNQMFQKNIQNYKYPTYPTWYANDIIEQMKEVYFKSKNENFNPRIKENLKKFCCMPEEKRRKIIEQKPIVEKMDVEIKIAESTNLTNEEKEKLEIFRSFRRGYAAVEKIAIKKNQKDFFEYALNLDLENLDPYDMKFNFDVFKKCSDAEIKAEFMRLDEIFKTIMESDTKTNETQKSGPRR